MDSRFSRFLSLATLFLAPLLVFLAIADEVRERESVRVDSAFLTWLHGFASPNLDTVAIFLTSLGNSSTIIVITLILGAWLISRKMNNQAVFFLGSIAGAAGLDFILKIVFHRARPTLWSPVITEPDYSFPSGHAMISSALALSLICLLWNTKWRYAALSLGILYVLLVGLSRLYLGVHFPTDIVAGWCVSGIWIGIMAHLTTDTNDNKKRLVNNDQSVTFKA